MARLAGTEERLFWGIKKLQSVKVHMESVNISFLGDRSTEKYLCTSKINGTEVKQL